MSEHPSDRTFLPPDERRGNKAAKRSRPRRVGSLVLILGIAAGSGAGGWWAGTLIESPASIAAESEPPPEAVITAPVVSMELSIDIVTRGDVSYGTSTPVIIEQPPALLGARPLYTALPSVDDTLSDGGVALEVSFRPVILLEGLYPSVRDMEPGLEGPDVVQLQTALSRLGFYQGDADGKFGPGTQAAVADLYASLGYAAVGADRGVRHVVVPQAEILFVEHSPVRVASVDATIGDDPTTTRSPITISGTTMSISAAIAPADASRIETGQAVSIVDDSTGETTPGQVTAIASRSGTDTDHPGLVIVDVAPTEETKYLEGINVKLTIAIQHTDGPVLAVPAGAVFTGVDGASHLEVLTPSGETRLLDVQTGITANGMIEVSPVAGLLTPDDEVVIGGG